MQQADLKELAKIQDEYGFRVTHDVKNKSIYKIIDHTGKKVIAMAYVTRHKAEMDLVEYVKVLEQSKAQEQAKKK